jgi:hypothetical protein
VNHHDYVVSRIDELNRLGVVLIPCFKEHGEEPQDAFVPSIDLLAGKRRRWLGLYGRIGALECAGKVPLPKRVETSVSRA